MRKQACVLFSGHVQGVGFRFTTTSIARRYQVVGTVANLVDGQVEIIVEGEELEVRSFLNEIRSSSLARYIADEVIQWGAETKQFTHFVILA